MISPNQNNREALVRKKVYLFIRPVFFFFFYLFSIMYNFTTKQSDLDY